MLVALLGACFLGQAGARAGTSGVLDGAGFFSAEARKRAEKTIVELERTAKKDLLIETVAEVPAEVRKGVDPANKAALKRMFETWSSERAREHKVNGVYVLLTREPAHLQVAVGNDTQRKTFSLADRDALVETMLRPLRAKRFDDALLDGVGFVEKTVQSRLALRKSSESRAVAPSAAAPSPREAATQDTAFPEKARSGSGVPLFGILLLGAIVVVGFFVVVRILRALFGGGRANNAAPGNFAGAGAGAGGGGFFRSLLGGVFGAAAGMWLYNQFTGHGTAWGGDASGSGGSGDAGSGGQDTDYSSSGGDFGDSSGGGDFGGGDAGGGGDF